jgi:hypothetical protein
MVVAVDVTGGQNGLIPMLPMMNGELEVPDWSQAEHALQHEQLGLQPAGVETQRYQPELEPYRAKAQGSIALQHAHIDSIAGGLNPEPVRRAHRPGGRHSTTTSPKTIPNNQAVGPTKHLQKPETDPTKLVIRDRAIRAHSFAALPFTVPPSRHLLYSRDLSISLLLSQYKRAKGKVKTGLESERIYLVKVCAGNAVC